MPRSAALSPDRSSRRWRRGSEGPGRRRALAPRRNSFLGHPRHLLPPPPPPGGGSPCVRSPRTSPKASPSPSGTGPPAPERGPTEPALALSSCLLISTNGWGQPRPRYHLLLGDPRSDCMVQRALLPRFGISSRLACILAGRGFLFSRSLPHLTSMLASSSCSLASWVPE